jgi:hypothetical protein
LPLTHLPEPLATLQDRPAIGLAITYIRNMLARYQIVRGKAASELPRGLRVDIRKHTRHFLHPDPDAVARYLAAPSEAAFQRFARDYRKLLEQRFAQDRASFDELARRARDEDVYLGCNCPTAKNPRVDHCHTWLALEFFREHYPDLDVRMPSTSTADEKHDRGSRRRSPTTDRSA